MCDLRGNIDTRLRKLDEGNYDAIVLAEAGLQRLGLASRITQILPLDLMLPAIGQGALGIETRATDQVARQTLIALDHGPTHQAVLAERALLAGLHGGCLAPIAAFAHCEGCAIGADRARAERGWPSKNRGRRDDRDRLSRGCGEIRSARGGDIASAGGGRLVESARKSL